MLPQILYVIAPSAVHGSVCLPIFPTQNIISLLSVWKTKYCVIVWVSIVHYVSFASWLFGVESF